MKKLLPLILGLLIGITTRSQNLILNGDFEQQYSCPTALSMIDTAVFWHNATINGTPDYFHQCGNPFFAGVPVNGVGFQMPHAGEGYAGVLLFQGLTPNYREFMIGQLAAPLTAGSCYHFEMFLSLGHYFKHVASNIAVYFSDTMITGIIGAQMQNFTPVVSNPPGAYPDTVNWMSVSGDFTATGGESFVVIGNFENDASLDTLTIFPLALWQGTYVYIDDVTLTACTGVNEHGNKEVKVFPNPVQDVLTVQRKNSHPAELILYNYAMQIVMQKKFTGNISLDLKSLKQGVYFYRIQSETEIEKSGNIIKAH